MLDSLPTTKPRGRPLRAVYRQGYRLLRPVSAAFRARALRRGPDVTSMMAGRSALVLAPHADDETLGCAATIMRKHDAGARVHVLVATDGRKSHPSAVIAPDALVERRRAEARAAIGVMGLDPESDLTLLDYPDGALAAHGAAVQRDVAAAIERLRPDDVFVTSSVDAHPDHQALAKAARGAARVAGFRGALLEYPVWYWERLPWTHRPRHPLAVAWHLLRDPVAEWSRAAPCRVSTDGLLSRKRAALEAHRSQVAPLDGSDEALLPPEFLSHFFQPYEVFYRVRIP